MKSMFRSSESETKSIRDIPGVLEPKPSVPSVPVTPQLYMSSERAVAVACEVVAGAPPPMGQALQELQKVVYAHQVRGDLAAKIMAWWESAPDGARDAYTKGALTGRWALLLYDPTRK